MQRLTRQEPWGFEPNGLSPRAGRLKRAGAHFTVQHQAGQGGAGTGLSAAEPTQAAPQHSHCAPSQEAQHPLQKKNNPEKPKQHHSHQALLVLAGGSGI